tara:strand:- start:857 stop:1270 length:414 start_codon:yes stop_codon:yes gene_type:complete
MKIIYLLLLLIPNSLLADTSNNPPCLQTLICDVNGAFLKDNKDNRACIKEVLMTQSEQKSDIQPMCLSQTTIDNNPQIDFKAGRTDPLPLMVELPEVPEALPPKLVFIIEGGFPREERGDSRVTVTPVTIELPPIPK